MSDIRDYFLIGDLHTSALISKNASIDWLCFPHFDSPSIFAKMLDKKGGEFSIKANKYNIESDYIKNTAIVKTIFKKKNSSFIVKDFMVPQPRSKIHTHVLVRKIISNSGKHEINLNYKPKINYGKRPPKIIRKNNSLITKLGKGNLILHLPKNSEIKIKNGNGECLIKIKLRSKEKAEFVLEHCWKKGDYKNKDLEKKTKNFWRRWVSKGNFFEFCRDNLIRSAITLKLMQFYPTGALIAAPTTSLPEAIKGNRNWDYRYSWIRDANFTLYAFYVLGYTDEARRFFNFIEKISKKSIKKEFDLDCLYTIDGKRPPNEKSLKNLSGYKNSKPVRIGNDAIKQFQLDVYGTLIDSYYFMLKKGFRISRKKRKIILDLVNNIEKKWKKRDSGIWEFREEIHNYTYSKVMAWLGVERVLRMSDLLEISKERRKELEKLEEDIRYWIWNNCYDYKKGKLLRYPKSKHQDSTNFLFLLLQFLHKKDIKTKKIIDNTYKELKNNRVFIFRYKEKDKFLGKEGAFVLCTFWLISALAILKDVKEAERLFKKFEKLINRNGLMSEEINPKTKDYLGNYPQAFSHIGYIMSAYYIDRYKRKKFSLPHFSNFF